MYLAHIRSKRDISSVVSYRQQWLSKKSEKYDLCIYKRIASTVFQAVFTCSKSTIERLEQGVKYVQS